MKDENGKWNTVAHKNRIVHFGEEELQVLAKTFEGDTTKWKSTKLVSIHNKEIIDVLRKLSLFSKHVEDYSQIITVALDETNAVNAGIIKRNTIYPNMDKYEMIYNGPQFYVGNPCYKTPELIAGLIQTMTP